MTATQRSLSSRLILLPNKIKDSKNIRTASTPSPDTWGETGMVQAFCSGVGGRGGGSRRTQRDGEGSQGRREIQGRGGN